MIQIVVNNNKCQLDGPIKKLVAIHKAFKVRNPNAFYIKKMGNVQPGWDGMINYVSPTFAFKTGLFPKVVNYIEDELRENIDVVDMRDKLPVKPKFPKKVGNLTPFPYQEKAIKAAINNEVGGIHFPIGVQSMATNAGKTLIMAGIYLAYKRKIPAIVLINEADLYDQFKREIPELVGDDAGFVRGKEANWNKFTVVMVQTVSRNLSKYKNELSKFGMVLVDECDLGSSKSYTSILTKCYNANIRIGLSGSIYMEKLVKYKPKQMNLRSYFGNIIAEISKEEMQEAGYSTKIIIKVTKGNEKPGDKAEKDWKAEYDRLIVYNEKRTQKVIDRLSYNAKLKRLPALVVCRYRHHVELLHQAFQNQLGNKYSIAYAHGDVKNRKDIIKDFREGDIDILITSYIIKRGKNLPKTKLLINAAGSDSQSTVMQLMGRLERKDESKKKAYMEDFYDEGTYARRHSKHRVNYYKKEGMKLYEKYKN